MRSKRIFGGCTLALLLMAGSVKAVTVHLGDLLVADPQGGSGHGVIYDVNPVTGVQTVVASGNYLDQPAGIAWDAASGTILVADFGGLGAYPNGAILRIDPATGAQWMVSSGGNLRSPVSVVIDGNGQLVVGQQGANASSSAVLRIDPVSGAQTVVSSGLSVIDDVLVNTDGNYVASQYANPSAIIGISSATGLKSTLSQSGLLNQGPAKMWLDETKPHRVLVANYNDTAGGALLAIDTVTGGQTIVSWNGQLGRPLGVTQDASGATYVTTTNATETSGTVVRVDLNTGAQSLVSSGSLMEPLSIVVVAPEPGTAVVGVGMLVVAAGRMGVRGAGGRGRRCR